MKHIKQRFSCPIDRNISPRCVHKTNAGNVAEGGSKWTGMKPSQPWTLPEARRNGSNSQQSVTEADLNYPSQVDCLVQLPLPKYYVLESNPEKSSQQIPHPEPHGEVEVCPQMSLPKYYILESSLDAQSSSLPMTAAAAHSDNSELFEKPVTLSLPKYYILESETQNNTQASHLQASDHVV